MGTNRRLSDRINARRKCVIEKRGVKYPCHLKDLSLDANGVGFISSSKFFLHEHVILEIGGITELGLDSVECVLRVMHVTELHDHNVYGCQVIHSNEEFRKFVEQKNNTRVSFRSKLLRDLMLKKHS
ncbi:PilZ domain-containing protein [Thiomicrorhabdus xiamenensis]|uniref:PilZ domain-containing protein n=1 Tax=Thiomicrorhabdus xiamenensis TaxID=2739063 RepID=A0A7D4NMA8_9GAMM|nr:PilZ domain-containing protein [Thiomicrorhabdus xiamenensis]QKI89914.1 PilZ domain-containing protein [Thiomicrorhabdus xiamenensis]